MYYNKKAAYGTLKQKLKAIKAGIKTGNNQYYRSATASELNVLERFIGQPQKSMDTLAKKKLY